MKNSTFKKFLIAILFLVSPFSNYFLSINTPAGEITAFRIVLLLLFIITLLSGHRIQFITIKNISYNYFIILFFISFITIFWCKDITTWIKYEFFIVEGVMLIVVFHSNLNIPKDYCFCLVVFNLTIFSQALVGLMEYLFKKHLFVDPIMSAEIARFGTYHPVAMQGNVNEFGTLMFFGVCISCALVSISPKIIHKLIFVSMIGFYTFMAYLSSSRASLASIILVFGILYFLLIVCRPIKKAMLKAGISLIFLCAVVISLQYVIGYMNEYTYSNMIRFNLIKSGFNYLVDTAFMGIGSGQETYYLVNHPVFPTRGVFVLHNLWMTILVSYGILFFAYYIVNYVRIAKRARKNIMCRDKMVKGICICNYVWLIGFCLACVSSSSIFRQEWYWAFFALIISFDGLLSTRIKK